MAMPTPRRNEPTRGQPHRHRGVAESFGADAEHYDRTRPTDPAPLVARIVTAMPGRQLLDVGYGTGIAARQFRDAGCVVFGIDPDARMAEFARRSGIDVEIARFEGWEPAGRRFDGL